MTLRSTLFIVSLLALTLANVSEVQAQRLGDLRFFWEGFSTEEYDDTRIIYVGITMPTLSYSGYSIKKKLNWNVLPVETTVPNDQFAYIASRPGYDMGFGLPIRIRLNRYLSVKSGIDWNVFNGGAKSGKRIEYGFYLQSDSLVQMQRGKIGEKGNFLTLEFPLHLHIRSDNKYFSNNFSNSLAIYRLYLLGGVRATKNINANSYYDAFDFNHKFSPIIVKPWYMSYEIGLGLDLIVPYFKLSPEIRFSQSFSNLLDHSRHQNISNIALSQTDHEYQPAYMNALERLGIRRFQFSLIFE